MTKTEIRIEALARATNGQSVANYAAIFDGFEAKGIAPDQILPRENVLTFEAWRAVGRHVRKGEHGVKVVTWVERKRNERKADGSTEERTSRFCKSTTVFHVTQTDPDEPIGKRAGREGFNAQSMVA